MLRNFFVYIISTRNKEFNIIWTTDTIKNKGNHHLFVNGVEYQDNDFSNKMIQIYIGKNITLIIYVGRIDVVQIRNI